MLRDLGATEQLVNSAKFASAHVLDVLKSIIRMKLILMRLFCVQMRAFATFSATMRQPCGD